MSATSTLLPIASTPALFQDEVVEHLPALRDHARTLVPASDVDDLVQEGIEQALRSQALFQPGTTLLPWLKSILRSHAFTRGRRAKLHQRAMRDITAMFPPFVTRHAESCPSAYTDLDVRTAFARLPDRMQRALVLTYVEGVSVIASTRVRTVKSPAQGLAFFTVHRSESKIDAARMRAR